MPDIILGAKDIAMTKAKYLPLQSLCFSWEKGETYNTQGICHLFVASAKRYYDRVL